MTTLTRLANSYAADGSLGAWTNPGNVYADDGVYATRAGSSKSTWYGNLFGFDLSALPDGATINSIILTAQWHNSSADSSGPVLLLGAKSGGNEVGSVSDTSGQTSDEVVTYQFFGLSAANLKATGASGFWAILRFRRTDTTTHTAYVDYIQVVVDYTVSSTGAASITLDDVSISAAGNSHIHGAAAVTLDDAGQSSAGSVAVKGAASVTMKNAGLSAAGTAPSGQSTGAASLSLTDAGITAAGKLAAKGSATIGLDSATGAGAGKISVSGATSQILSGITAAASGKVAVKGAASVTMANAGLTSSGKVAVKGVGAVSLQDAGISATGQVAAVVTTGALAATLGNAQAQGSGKVLVHGAAGETLAGTDLDAEGQIGKSSIKPKPHSLPGGFGGIIGGLGQIRF